MRSSTPIVGVSYLFYFDQNHLSFEGRLRSLEIARSLIPELIFKPNRAMVVSSGRRVELLTGWTSDQRELLDAVDHLEQHPEEGDVFPMRESDRVLHVQQTLQDALDQSAGWVRLLQDGVEVAARKREFVAATETDLDGS